MEVMKYAETEPIRVAPGVNRRFVHTERLMTVIVDLTEGPKSVPDPFHSHPHDQTTYVASGEVLFFMEGESPEHLHPGDLVAIPANKPHAIQLLSETARLIDNFTPLREDFF